ncbi:hypothetical protein KY289_023573 [Solanum tuberosum]|nr:hypothetical protein KY289_023573 [Solanum tuberosum]
MTTKSPGQPLTGVDLDLKEREPTSRLDFLAAVRPSREANAMALKPIVYFHGEPRIVWEEEEGERMIVKENLEYAVIGKISYGWPEIQDLRKLIPKQCKLKGECNIGLLSNKHILIRALFLEDYVNLLSKPTFYILHRGWTYPMRTLKWEPMFDPEEETSTAMALISFPSLPPNFFVKEAVFSLAAAVGKPLQVDLATRNQTRPSYARVKVDVGLLREFPKKINVGMRKQSGEITEKWITIRYDHVPKYCKNCKIQGHDEEQCYVLHTNLYPKEKEGKKEEMETGEIHGKGRVQREGNSLGKESEEFKIHTNRRGA